ncbi:ExeA family protein [Desulfopila aestuarii]|uniref:General secretion pathway protein A n=1 Tax=Desulfopila aestuarii DSM 18488 TaxID=1121416 RepID=A0A1M7YE14_9BACT|nr:AAA family ATPase [Desulfopila aestuarii]SHO50882.1 general secretion pathway protein A [Desulfopila aestuarii DSM 18488]
MYTGYFGLTEAPFGISPNPRYLYMSESHREALAHLLYGISSDGCMILLTGDVGTGKTTLCRCLLDQLPDNTEVAVILNPRLTARELLKTICEELELLPDHTTGSIKTYIDALNAHLLRAHANDRNIAIIVDEAQNLAIDVLEQLRLLTNLETPTRKLLRIVLLGQPELREMLERPELSQVNQRITSRFHLGPLQPDDVQAYIQHRLNVAGDHSSSLFSDKAIRHAISLTGGIPRLINVLCDRALLGAYAINTDHVDLEIMKQAGEELFPNKYKKEHTRKKAAIIAGSLLAILAVPAVVFIPDWLQSPPSKPVTSTTEQVAPTTPEKLATTEARTTIETTTATEEQPPVAQKAEPEMVSSKTQEIPAEEQPTPEPNEQIQLHENITESPALPPVAQQVAASVEEKVVEENAAVKKPAPPPAPTPELATEHVEVATPAPPIVEALPSNADQSAESVEQMEESMSPPSPPPPTVKPQETTIKVSDPLLVREKAGAHPQKAVQELIAR